MQIRCCENCKFAGKPYRCSRYRRISQISPSNFAPVPNGGEQMLLLYKFKISKFAKPNKGGVFSKIYLGFILFECIAGCGVCDFAN